jgi:hypothetical protein
VQKGGTGICAGRRYELVTQALCDAIEYDPRGLLRNDRALTGTGLSVEPPRQLHVAVDRLARFRDSKATRDILSSLLKNLSVFNTTVCSRWGLT